MNKKFFTISVIFSIIFMVFVVIEALDRETPSPAALFYLFMPTLLIGFSYHVIIISDIVKKLILITNISAFSFVGAYMTLILIMGKEVSLADLGFTLTTGFVIAFVILNVFLLLYVVLVFSLAVKTINVFPKYIKELHIVALVILSTSLFVDEKYYVIQVITVFSLVIIQGINIYILRKDL